MDREHWRKLKEILGKALTLPSEQRFPFIKEVSGMDRALFEELLTLIRDHDTGDRFLEAGVDIDREEDDYEGCRLGPYEIKTRIGSGGMGSVYLAHRADGAFDKQVAIKVIKPGMDTRAILARFREERQILANLEHPNIAKLLDGGSTPEGSPYFVMDYIDGLPLPEYCLQHQLPLRERLKLIHKVCCAVHFIHRNLVVHRDLKPANVLVTAEGEPKILDFGIAKVLHEEGRDGLTHPLTNTLAMTPEYASPEQIHGDRITTASDVYSLGVLLCEVITGRRPYRLSGLPHAEIRRIIREQTSPKPSDLAAESLASPESEQVGETDPARQAEIRRIGKWSHQVVGDLDHMVTMALQKEPERRYASALQLAEDLDRYLRAYPVIAAPDTFAYRAGRFIKRNLFNVVIATTAFLLVLGLSIALFFQQKRTERERDRARIEKSQAQQTLDVLMDLLELPDPFHLDDEDFDIRTILERAETGIATSFEEQPGARSELMHTLGRMYCNLGLFEKAEPLLREALAIRREVFGDQSTQVGLTAKYLGQIHTIKGDFIAAEAAVGMSLQALRATLDKNDDELLEVQRLMSQIFYMTGQYSKAIEICRKVVETHRARHGDDHPSVALARSDLATFFTAIGKYREAEALYRQLMPVVERQFGSTHPAYTISLSNFANVLLDLQKLEEAETAMRQTLAIEEKTLEPDHQDLGLTLSNLANLLIRRNKIARAKPYALRAEAIFKQKLGTEHQYYGKAVAALAIIYIFEKDFDRAEDLAEKYLTIIEKIYGSDHPEYARALILKVKSYRNRGDLPKLEAWSNQALDILSQKPTENLVRESAALYELASIYLEHDKANLAEAPCLRALEIREEHFEQDALLVREARDLVIQVLRAGGKTAQGAEMEKRWAASRNQAEK